ncbi:MAG: amidase family protein [Propylenella sp.]
MAAILCSLGLMSIAPPRLAAAPTASCRSEFLEGIDLQSVTIPELQAALDVGTLTSRGLVEEYIRRIAEYDSGGAKLNAVRQLNDNALAQADALDAERRRTGKRGPLHGIPVLLKDNIGTIDAPTTAGSIALEGSIPLHDAFLTERLRQAGAIIMGKANLSEFANWVSLTMPSGYSSLGGQVLNPYHFGDPSGSSSGSAVAAAMALATVTVGTETSGSILSPSLANSVVGIKPTVGLVSRAGVIPLAATFDTPGPITRNVTDAAVMLGAMTGVDPRDPATTASEANLPPNADYRPFLRTDGLTGVRLGVSDADRDSLNAAQRQLWDNALATLERLGATIVHSDTDTLSVTRNAGLVEIAVIPNEFKHYLNKYLADETAPDLRVKTLTEIIEFNKEHPDKVKYGQNLLQISDLTLGNVDEPTAVASRTAAIEGSRTAIGVAMLADDLDAILTPNNFNANIGAAALYPSIAVPAGYTEGGTRPFGITFLGPAYSEPTLIAFAYAFEQSSAPRIRPTEVNRALCTGPAAAAPTVGGTKTSKPKAPAARDGLPATGVGPAWMLALAFALFAIAMAGWLRRSA